MSMWILRACGQNSELAGDTVVETRADADHQIGVVHGEVGLDRAVHAQHADELRAGRGKAPRPISVSVQGAPVWRTSSVKAAQASGPAFTSPPPP